MSYKIFGFIHEINEVNAQPAETENILEHTILITHSVALYPGYQLETMVNRLISDARFSGDNFT